MPTPQFAEPCSPLVSVIIPAYNAAEFLALTLDSLLNQTYRNWHAVVIDDGSTDETGDIAWRYAARDGRFTVLQQPNSGISSVRNLGLRSLPQESKYVAFLDSDDIWLPDALERMVRDLGARPDCIAVHGLAEYIDAQGRSIDEGSLSEFGRKRIGFDGRGIVQWPLDKPTSFEILSINSSLTPPSVALCKTEHALRCGDFDTKLKQCEDWDWFLRLSRQGDIGFLNHVVVLYRRHAHNVTNNRRELWAYGAQVRLKAFRDPKNSPAQSALLKGSYKALQIYRLKEKWAAGWGLIRRGKVVAGLRQIAAGTGLLGRWVRGVPTARG